MKVAIIGAGIAGLVAGRELTQAGHDVTVIEKGRNLGGRLSSVTLGESGAVADNGVTWLTTRRQEFRPFASDLIERELLTVWGESIYYYNGESMLQERPPFLTGTLYAAPKGLSSIAGDLSRWVDLEEGERAIGLTYFGPNRRKKRAWMVNLASSRTIEADAVVIATPAPEAFGVLLTTQDEVDIFKITREIDSIHYEAALTLSIDIGVESRPDWDGVVFQDDVVREVICEESKREGSTGCYTVVTTDRYAREMAKRPSEEVVREIWGRVSALTGLPNLDPLDSHLHYWPFYKPKSVIQNTSYLEFGNADAPLAVVGDYFDGNDTESSFCSGLALATAWIERLEPIVQPA